MFAKIRTIMIAKIKTVSSIKDSMIQTSSIGFEGPICLRRSHYWNTLIYKEISPLNALPNQRNAFTSVSPNHTNHAQILSLVSGNWHQYQ